MTHWPLVPWVEDQLRQVEEMDFEALRTIVSNLVREVGLLMGRVRAGVPPAPPPAACPQRSRPSQSDAQQLFQEQQCKADKELQQLKQELQSHVASTQQIFRSQEKELCSALRSEYEADLGCMRQQVGRAHQAQQPCHPHPHRLQPAAAA